MSAKKGEGNTSEETTRSKVDLDTILIEEIGQFGKYQIKNLVYTLVAVLFSGFHVQYVFTTARISTRCFIPECELDPSKAEYAPSWILNAVPGTTDSFDNCQRYAVSNYSSSSVGNDTCPANLFDTNNLVTCEQYVYETQQTVVYDYNLACDEWSRTLIGFVRTCGTLFALPITGYISDKWGRKTALTFNTVNAAWLGVIRYWANSYLIYTLSQTIEAILAAGVFSCSYILVLELVGPQYRVIAGAILSTSFAAGQMCMGLIAWAVPDWRPLTLALYIPQFLTIAYIWILSESIRWYMSKGKYEKSEAMLKEAARVNGKQLSAKSLEALKLTAEEEKKRKALEELNNVHEPLLVVQVLRNRKILIRCIVSPVWWITVTLVYYGLSINAVNMSGNAYLNYVAVAAAEIPGFWLSLLLMERIGRKPVLIGAFWMCTLCQIAYLFIPNNIYGVSLSVYLIGKCSISTVVTAIYVYTTELYPTKHRHNLFAFSSMIGRIGSITAPLTPAIGASTFEGLPFVLFGSFSFLSGMLMFFTPETLGTKLPDTMEEAAELGLKKNYH